MILDRIVVEATCASLGRISSAPSGSLSSLVTLIITRARSALFGQCGVNAQVRI